MWRLLSSYLLHISPSFGASGGLCFVTVAFSGYLHLYLCSINHPSLLSHTDKKKQKKKKKKKNFAINDKKKQKKKKKKNFAIKRNFLRECISLVFLGKQGKYGLVLGILFVK